MHWETGHEHITQTNNTYLKIRCSPISTIFRVIMMKTLGYYHWCPSVSGNILLQIKISHFPSSVWVYIMDLKHIIFLQDKEL